MNFQRSVIIGGGLLGEELNNFINANGGNSKILKNIEYNSDNIIPENTETVFVVAQSSDYKKNPMTITEITESVLKKKSMKSVRPNCTINAILQRSQYVTKTERGCYKLNSNVKF